MASTPDTPDTPEEPTLNLQDAVARAVQPSLLTLRNAAAHMQKQQRQQALQTLQSITQSQDQFRARFSDQWTRYMREVLARNDEHRRAMVRHAMNQWTHGIRTAAAAAQQQTALNSAALRATASLDTTGLSRLLRDVDEWRILTDQQRSTALAAIQRAYGTTREEEVSEDLVTELEDTVHDFISADTEYLPISVSRQNFILFIGTIVLISLMTLAFTSDMADGVMGKTLELSGVAGLAMVAAGKAFDRYSGTQDSETGEES
ncbi:hypothetical protein [Streptomyces griseosporeus]